MRTSCTAQGEHAHLVEGDAPGAAICRLLPHCLRSQPLLLQPCSATPDSRMQRGHVLLHDADGQDISTALYATSPTMRRTIHCTFALRDEAENLPLLVLHASQIQSDVDLLAFFVSKSTVKLHVLTRMPGQSCGTPCCRFSAWRSLRKYRTAGLRHMWKNTSIMPMDMTEYVLQLDMEIRERGTL